MEINSVQTVKVNAKTLKIHCKVCDTFSAELISATGTRIANQDQDYVPSFMPGQHYGDYLILDVDIDTGNLRESFTGQSAQYPG